MTGLPFILSIIFLICLGLHIYSERKWQANINLITKSTCSILFLSIAISSYLVFDAENLYSLMIISALTLGMIGDILLVYGSKNKYFISGLSAFLLGQIVYAITFLMFNGIIYIDIIIYLLLFVISIILYKIFNIKLNNLILPVILYVLSINFMLVSALSGLYKDGFHPTQAIVIFIGALLFVASDIVLAIGKFSPSKKGKKYMSTINLSLYYPAQLILALSIVSMTFFSL